VSTAAADYTSLLQETFAQYREARFDARRRLFKYATNGAVVFRYDCMDRNVLVPPFASDDERRQILESIAPKQRHRHFASMRSSQALAQSVFGTIGILGRLPLISSIRADDGRLAFGPALETSSLTLEKSVGWLGEPRSTSIDVWISAENYNVAIECKLAENVFGQCSRPHLRPDEPAFKREYCDGSYTRQQGRAGRCALTEIGVHYWKYTGDLMGWAADVDHTPCPLRETYQLVRNVLAACTRGERLDTERGHALVIYDRRNPTMSTGGHGEAQWKRASDSLRPPGALRRLSWQAFIGQWPSDAVLDWLKDELAAKYGLRPKS
jgi:Restriction Endonuclease associating with ARP